MTATDGVKRRRPLRVPKMAELVAQDLRRQIVRGDVAEGEMLPPESALMARFGVSRPTLREAYRVLENEGLISVRRGAHGGARVQTPDHDAAARYVGLVLEYRGTTVEDVFAARAVIEPPCVALLARRRNRSDLAQLRAAVDRAREAREDPTTFLDLHNDFHELVIELAGNQTLAVLNGLVRDIIEMSSETHVAADAGSIENVKATRKGFRAHERVVELIEARDAEGAEALWRLHLDEARDYILTNTGRKTVLDLLG